MLSDSKNPPATLTGLAVGDALGMPFETLSHANSRLLAWDGSYQASNSHNLKPGQWTDDTMMAKSIAASLVEVKDFSPSDIARRYVDWYKSGQPRGMGKVTAMALGSLAQGTSWVKSGINKAEGNGSAMRAAPLGLYYRRDLETVVRITSIEAGITHDSNIARQGAIAVALGVAVLTRRLYEHDQTKDLVQLILPYLEDTPIKYRLLSASAKAKNKYERPWETLADMGTGAHVLQTVPAAFFAFLNSRSYKDTIETSIRAGGDTDTTAAIAGALAGTHYGISQVAEYLPGLEAVDELRDLEQRLWVESKGLWNNAFSKDRERD